MAILIRNPEVERKARELAARRGLSITAAVHGALDQALAEIGPKRPRPTVEEMLEATRRFREEAGVSGPQPPVTRADFDALWEDDAAPDRA